MKMRRLASLIILALAATGCAARPTPAPAPVALQIAGASSLQPTLEDLAQAFQREQPNVMISVRGGGTDLGIQQVRDGRIDLAAVSWKPEGKALPEGVEAFPLARDGVAIIVHPTNTITNLTTLQARALFRGETLSWAALGGGNGEPLVLSREDGSGTRAAFESLVMGGARVTLNALVLPTSQTLVDYVASHRDAVGYVSTAALNDAVKAVPLEEIAPTAAAVRSGEYRLGRVLYLYAPATPTAAARAFLDFALSPAGQVIVAKRLTPVR